MFASCESKLWFEKQYDKFRCKRGATTRKSGVTDRLYCGEKRSTWEVLQVSGIKTTIATCRLWNAETAGSAWGMTLKGVNLGSWVPIEIEKRLSWQNCLAGRQEWGGGGYIAAHHCEIDKCSSFWSKWNRIGIGKMYHDIQVEKTYIKASLHWYNQIADNEYLWQRALMSTDREVANSVIS